MVRTVRQIIKDAGGPERIAAASVKASARDAETPKVSVKGVYNWVRIGIPEKHWPLMLRLAKADAGEVYRANRMLRQRPTGSAARANAA